MNRNNQCVYMYRVYIVFMQNHISPIYTVHNLKAHDYCYYYYWYIIRYNTCRLVLIVHVIE
jgi:hypothetical protein